MSGNFVCVLKQQNSLSERAMCSNNPNCVRRRTVNKVIMYVSLVRCHFV